MENYPLEIVERVSDFLITGSPPEPALGWFWVVPAIMGAVSLINSAVQRRNDRRNQDRQNAANLALADKQFEQSQQQIAEMNKYNDPAAQMRRFQGAGLNPNLIYGSGSQSAGNQTQTARYEPPAMRFDARAIQLPQVLNEFQNFQMRQAQINNVKAHTDNIREKTATESVTRFLRDIQGKRGQIGLERDEYQFEFQNAVVANRARMSAAQVEQEWQKLANLSQDEQLKLLVRRQKEKGLELMDIEQEQRQADLVFSQYKNEWAKMGITSGDNVMLRLLIRMFNEAGLDLSDMSIK